jgi:signal transduction histidine kinase
LVESKGLKLQFNAPAEPLNMEGDEAKIRQVISNLLSNATKFSDKGVIRVDLKEEKGQILCSVSDQGPGIAKENLEKVFDRFFQEKKSTRGAGLGLAIAKAWVEAHGGKIWVETSSLLQGTRINFFLPTAAN